jgi:hypothetical protein
MGTKGKKPFNGPLTDRHSKRQKQLVEAGFCCRCGSPLGRAVTVCDKCADQACAAEAAAAAADKAAAQSLCQSRHTNGQLGPIAIDWKKELQEGRIRAQVIYSNRSNRRQAEQVEAALQEWDPKQNQRDSDNQRFSLHQRWFKNFAAKPCEGHVLLVEVTKEFFAAHKKTIFLLKASGNLHVGPGGKVVN